VGAGSENGRYVDSEGHPERTLIRTIVLSADANFNGNQAGGFARQYNVNLNVQPGPQVQAASAPASPSPLTPRSGFATPTSPAMVLPITSTARSTGMSSM